MCGYEKRRVFAIALIAFGAGILLSCFLRGFILTFIEAAAVIAAGVLLLNSSK